MTEMNDFVVLENGRKADIALYGAVIDVAQDRIMQLDKGVPFTSKQLLGMCFWSGLERGEQSLAGMCLLDAVRKGLLPLLSEHLWSHEYPKKFRIQ